jgi:hypothetical protein
MPGQTRALSFPDIGNSFRKPFGNRSWVCYVGRAELKRHGLM